MIAGGGGHIFEMIARIKANEELLRKQKNKEPLEFHYGRKNPVSESRVYNDKERQESKRKIRRLTQVEHINTAIAIFIAVLITLLLGLWLAGLLKQ